METDVEDSIGFKSNLGKFTAPRAQSSQSPLLESADDWQVQFDVNDEGVSVKERPFPSEIAVVSGPGSRPDGHADKDSDMDRAHKPMGGESHQEAPRKDGQVQ